MKQRSTGHHLLTPPSPLFCTTLNCGRTVVSLITKSGYRGRVTAKLLRAMTVTRYQVTKARASYADYAAHMVRRWGKRGVCARGWLVEIRTRARTFTPHAGTEFGLLGRVVRIGGVDVVGWLGDVIKHHIDNDFYKVG